MFLRILSIGGPLWVYATTAVLIYGLFLERRRLEWLALVPAAGGLIASALNLTPAHRLFFDEDVYINVASNLTHAPANQLSVAGGPRDVQVSTYPKEPAGWPVLLSFAFLAAGTSETVAFWFARLLFALAIAAVYHLARAILPDRKQALTAAIMFGMVPICFWYSISAGTDMTAVLMATVGMWGLAAGNGALAAAGFAFAAQTRMELLLLVPLVWISSEISRKWKMAAAGLSLLEIVHVGWVISVAPLLERAEEVQSAFGIGHVGMNLWDNVRYLFNPFDFPIMITVLATLSLWRFAARQPLPKREALLFWIVGLFAVYLAFYAGSFYTNTRYSMQIVAPLTVLAASLARRPVWMVALLISGLVPAARNYDSTPYLQALQADHQLSVLFASHTDPDDLMISGVQEIFIDNGRPAINASFASTMGERLNEEIRKRRNVWYHAGVRANIPNSDEWRADRWVKSNFELHPIESHDVNGFRISFYEILTERIDRKAR
jgi:hypothetical protein